MKNIFKETPRIKRAIISYNVLLTEYYRYSMKTATHRDLKIVSKF